MTGFPRCRCGHISPNHHGGIRDCEICDCRHYQRADTQPRPAHHCDVCGDLTTRSSGICLPCEDDPRVGFTMPADRHDLPTRAHHTEIPS